MRRNVIQPHTQSVCSFVSLACHRTFLQLDILRFWRSRKMKHCRWLLRPPLDGGESTSHPQDGQLAPADPGLATEDADKMLLLLAERTENFTGADIAQLCRRALQEVIAQLAMHRAQIHCVTRADLTLWLITTFAGRPGNEETRTSREAT